MPNGARKPQPVRFFFGLPSPSRRFVITLIMPSDSM